MRGKVNISHIDHISEIMTAHIINIANIMYISTKKRGRGQTGLVSTTSASTKNAQAAQSANAHCNFGAPRALRRSLSVIHRERVIRRVVYMIWLTPPKSSDLRTEMIPAALERTF